jgi:Ser/Thr protein kinase RdoA (MazF antagonist)
MSADANVWRLDDHVYRPVPPWTQAVHALLRHLERVAFPGAPRLVGSGDEAGRQVLTFIPGARIHPKPWTDEAIARMGRLLRDLHAATASFEPPPGAVWMPW